MPYWLKFYDEADVSMKKLLKAISASTIDRHLTLKVSICFNSWQKSLISNQKNLRLTIPGLKLDGGGTCVQPFTIVDPAGHDQIPNADIGSV